MIEGQVRGEAVKGGRQIGKEGEEDEQTEKRREERTGEKRWR